MERLIQTLSELYINSDEQRHIQLLIIFVIVYVVFSIVDLIFGTIAIFKTKEGRVLQHIEVGSFKVISVILLVTLILLTLLIPKAGWIIRMPAYYMLGLLAFKEIISIIQYGMKISGIKKLFIYHFLTSIFDILVGKFFTKLKDETIQNIPKNDGEQKDSTNQLSD